MRFSTAFFLASLAALAIAVPTPTRTLNSRSVTECGQYDSVQTGNYIVYSDLWGEDNASSGSQCFTVDGLSGNTIECSTSWTWEGNPDDVKSYSNVVTDFTSTQLSGISSMDSTWDWSYSGSSVVSDVSYDMFTSSTAGGSNEYEIMVWLAALGGAGPISSTYGSDGDPTPIATATIDGHSFNLYKGPNGDTTVFSFVAASEITSFSGDVKAFFNYLIDNEGLPSSQYLTSVGAGTEAFTGSDAVFTTSGYSMSIST